MILFLIFLSSLTVALKILQTQRLKQTENQLNDATQRVVSYKDRQVTLTALKNRLTAIDKYIGVTSLQAGLLNLINTILPSSAAVSALVIDRSGEIVLSATVSSSSDLDQIINSLTDKDKNHGKISQVSIESLNRSRDGAFRVNLKIKPKE